jgi:hypothetical protein
MKVEVNVKKPKFRIVNVGNKSLLYEQGQNGCWLLRKVWVNKEGKKGASKKGKPTDANKWR